MKKTQSYALFWKPWFINQYIFSWVSYFLSFQILLHWEQHIQKKNHNANKFMRTRELGEWFPKKTNLPIDRIPLTCLTSLNSPTTVFTASSRCSSFIGADLPPTTSATWATNPLSTCTKIFTYNHHTNHNITSTTCFLRSQPLTRKKWLVLKHPKRTSLKMWSTVLGATPGKNPNSMSP